MDTGDIKLQDIIFEWNEGKNTLLKENRHISFEDIIIAIQNDKLIDIIPSPSPKHLTQECFVIEIEDYAYIVPFIMEEKRVFLKTIYPSRKHTKQFLRSK